MAKVEVRLSRRTHGEGMNGDYRHFSYNLGREKDKSFQYFILCLLSESLTEIYCDNPGASCNGTKFFTCQQDKTRLEVVFVERRDEEVIVRTVRNITVNIGCSCVTSKLRLFKHIAAGPEE